MPLWDHSWDSTPSKLARTRDVTSRRGAAWPTTVSAPEPFFLQSPRPGPEHPVGQAVAAVFVHQVGEVRTWPAAAGGSAQLARTAVSWLCSSEARCCGPVMIQRVMRRGFGTLGRVGRGPVGLAAR
jgi:hypothetical protein